MTTSQQWAARASASARLDPRTVDAVVLDTDGVLTNARALRSTAWQDTLNAYLAQYAHVTGRPRPRRAVSAGRVGSLTGLLEQDTAAALLQAQGRLANLAEQHLGPSGEDLLDLLVRHANHRFLELLRSEGVRARSGAGRLLFDLRAAGIRTAALSTGRHSEQLLRSAGLMDLLEARVDAADAEHYRLAGPPEPAMYRLALKRLHSGPGRAALLTDTPAGLAAGAWAGFGRLVAVAGDDAFWEGPEPAVPGPDAVVVQPPVR
ncbi:HAD family hydrolase [Kitasatospora cinereorecta]|uniref:HAD family hydrolase n=1 Tax=Kitasatospora cinereorecta TaxID=285560 RepID=A0ABW0V5V2_9ACTN